MGTIYRYVPGFQLCVFPVCFRFCGQDKGLYDSLLRAHMTDTHISDPGATQHSGTITIKVASSHFTFYFSEMQGLATG